MTSYTTPNDDNISDPMLQHFRYQHLTNPQMQRVSKQFAELAASLVRNTPRCPERTAALRHLLEAKDCAVRSTMTNTYVTVSDLSPNKEGSEE